MTGVDHGRSGAQGYVQRLPNQGLPLPPSIEYIPRSELLKALLVAVSWGCIFIRAASAGSAEAAGGARDRDQGWDSIHNAGAAGGEAAEAIGTEESGWLCASCDAQQ